MRESLVRAYEVRYAVANEGEEQGERIAGNHINRGFYWTKALSELLDQYEKKRDTYPTLDAFMPEIVKCFQNYDGPPTE